MGNETAFIDQLEDKHGAKEILDQKQPAQYFAGVLARLPEKERLVVTLFCLEGFTQQETAATLKLSKGRISQLYHRAITELKAGFGGPEVSFGKKTLKNTHIHSTLHTHIKKRSKKGRCVIDGQTKARGSIRKVETARLPKLGSDTQLHPMPRAV